MYLQIINRWNGMATPLLHYPIENSLGWKLPYRKVEKYSLFYTVSMNSSYQKMTAKHGSQSTHGKTNIADQICANGKSVLCRFCQRDFRSTDTGKTWHAINDGLMGGIITIVKTKTHFCWNRQRILPFEERRLATFEISIC